MKSSFSHMKVGNTKANVLMYADDSALVAEKASDLQVIQNRFNEACESMHLKTNAKKTRVVIFGMNEGMEEPNFAIWDAELGRVNEFGIWVECLRAMVESTGKEEEGRMQEEW